MVDLELETPPHLEASGMSFDTLAPAYRVLELIVAGRVLQRARLAHLANLGVRSRALLLGEGPGRFLEALLVHNTRIHCTCVENSPAMVKECRQMLRHRGQSTDRVRFLNVDARASKHLDGPFDLIATHFFLDCFQHDELERIVSNISDSAAPGAVWLISDFRIPARGWQRVRARIIHRLMYAVFRRITDIRAERIVPPDPYLVRSGFRLEARCEFSHGLIHSDLWHLTR
ncbi:MAG: hypothetical protein RLZ45_1480 [Verrucomicrobiota bacterium]